MDVLLSQGTLLSSLYIVCKVGLVPLNLLDAEIVYFGIYLHVLHTCEFNHFAVTRGQKLLQWLYCFSSKILPIIIQDGMVVDSDTISSLIINMSLITK